MTGAGCRRHWRANYLRDAVFAGRFEPNERFAGLIGGERESWDEYRLER